MTRTGGDRDVDLREKAAVARADPKQIGSAQVRGRAVDGFAARSVVAVAGLGIAATATRAGWE